MCLLPHVLAPTFALRSWNAIFYRHLRFEYLKARQLRNLPPLSSDALSGWGRVDAVSHNTAVKHATTYLLAAQLVRLNERIGELVQNGEMRVQAVLEAHYQSAIDRLATRNTEINLQAATRRASSSRRKTLVRSSSKVLARRRVAMHCSLTNNTPDSMFTSAVSSVTLLQVIEQYVASPLANVGCGTSTGGPKSGGGGGGGSQRWKTKRYDSSESEGSRDTAEDDSDHEGWSGMGGEHAHLGEADAAAFFNASGETLSAVFHGMGISMRHCNLVRRALLLRATTTAHHCRPAMWNGVASKLLVEMVQRALKGILRSRLRGVTTQNESIRLVLDLIDTFITLPSKWGVEEESAGAYGGGSSVKGSGGGSTSSTSARALWTQEIPSALASQFGMSAEDIIPNIGGDGGGENGGVVDVVQIGGGANDAITKLSGPCRGGDEQIGVGGVKSATRTVAGSPPVMLSPNSSKGGRRRPQSTGGDSEVSSCSGKDAGGHQNEVV